MKINEVIAEKIYSVTGADGKVTYTDKPSTHQGKVAVDKPGRLNIVGSNASNIKYQAKTARTQEKRAGNPGAKVADWTGKTNEADDDGWTQIEQGSLTSGEDVVLSKTGEQAVRDLKLSDQEVELLKAVALGWADQSDLGNLEQDIYNSWVENNPSAMHGGDDDPSDEIMNELESWFEDKHPDEARFDAEFKTADDRIKRDALADSEIKEWSKGNKKAADAAHDYKGSTDDRGFNRPKKVVKDDVEIARMLKLAGVQSEAAGKNTGTPPTPWRHSADWIRPEGGWSKKEVKNKRNLGKDE